MKSANISVGRALTANSKLQKKRTQTGYIKPPLLETSGDVGEQVYFLKHEIKDTFQPHFERINDLLQERGVLQEDMQELDKKERKNKTGLSKKDQEQLDSLTKEVKRINEELTEIENKKEEITFVKGKIKLSQIKKYADVGEWEVIDFAIDMELDQES